MISLRRTIFAAAALLVAGCGSRDDAPDTQPADNQAVAAEPSFSTSADAASAGWDLQASGEGTALVRLHGDGTAAIRLFCPAGRNELLVNVPAFRPIGSEERLSFGSGGEVEALVADTRGDALRGGVSGTGAVPANLPALIGGPVSASYGAQTSGPHPAPPVDLARGFVTACRDRTAPAPAPSPPPAKSAEAPAPPCMMQGDERLSVAPRRAVGTEPFWGARIEGRCVIYSHPEDQKGTRVWTRYSKTADGERWSGALGGRLFELRIRPQPGCSDGMSDTVYPQAAELVVGGETRRGCAQAG